MKHSLRTIIGFFAFCSLVVICFIFYTSHMAEKTSSVILGDDLKKTLAMNKEKEPSIETEGLRELEKAIALDKKSENEKVSHDKTIELEKKINVETNSYLSETSGKEVTRKKLLDEVRKGVVAIQVKSHASIQHTLTGQAWSGTGFIVSLENGLIATNHHVAGDMAVCTYEVKFSDGTTTTAKLKFFDPLLDFAFLTIDPKDFPASSIALEISKTPVKLNDTIYSMGNSAGDEFSTYKGTVFEIYETLGAFSEQSFKFSGLTVGGASGSPVFGENGKVVGIIYGGKFVSGAALPINYIARALDSLNKGNIPSRQSLGLVLRYNDLKDAVNVGVIPLEAATQYNKKFPMSHNKILVVETRMVNSHAESQLMAGDVIWKAQGEMIGPELAKFDEIIDSTVNKSISLEVYREGKLVSVDVKPYKITNDEAEKFLQFAGATWFDYNEQIRLLTGDKGPGVFISSADVTSPLKGLFKESFFGNSRPMKITHINGKPLKNLSDLEKLIPELLTKKMFDIRYIDFLGQQTFGQMVSADRQERFLVLKYDSKFDTPKILTFNKKSLEWDIKNIKNNNP